MAFGPHPNGPSNRDSRGNGEESSPPAASVLEANPIHRQFLHPHVLLDLGRDPPS